MASATSRGAPFAGRQSRKAHSKGHRIGAIESEPGSTQHADVVHLQPTPRRRRRDTPAAPVRLSGGAFFPRRWSLLIGVWIVGTRDTQAICHSRDSGLRVQPH
ncbi:MAG: hypothetical protein AAF959_26330 [Cyanobacteria bacterium P01_D01_bin.56]